MNAIIGFGQLLEIDDALNQEQRYSIEHINKASKHLLELINEVLDIAAIDANKLQLHPADIDLPVIISDTVNLIRPLAEQFNITVNNHVQDAPVTPIVADRQRLTQILLNLTSNAIKYNKPEGEVDIFAEQDDNHILVRIVDSGTGIKPADQALIFEPFKRIKHNSEYVDGTGIGLNISQRLAELMGGKISFTSTYQVGSEFILRLPV